MFGEVAAEDGGVELGHHPWAWEGVGAEDVSLRAVGAEGDGHGEDEVFDGVADELGLVTKLLIDAVVECFDAADAVLDYEGIDGLGEFVVGEEEVDELGVLGFEFGDSGESSEGGIDRGWIAWLGGFEIGVDDLVEGEVFGLGTKLAVESGGGDDGAEVARMVVRVSGRDEVSRRFDAIDGTLSA